MAKRRISIPEDHIALVLSADLSDELMSLMKQVRRTAKPPAPSHAIAGDIILALLEAKEA